MFVALTAGFLWFEVVPLGDLFDESLEVAAIKGHRTVN